MANLNVTFGDMQDSAASLSNGQQEIEAKLRELQMLVGGLVAGGYVTDKSSKAFDSSYQEFNEGATKTIQGLDGMSKYLKAAAEALGQTDEELAKALNK